MFWDSLSRNIVHNSNGFMLCVADLAFDGTNNHVSVDVQDPNNHVGDDVQDPTNHVGDDVKGHNNNVNDDVQERETEAGQLQVST